MGTQHKDAPMFATYLSRSLLFTSLALTAQQSLAHATLEQTKAEAGSYYKAVIRVPHGCEGQATEQVIVTLPTSFQGAKPMPKAGWQLSSQRGPVPAYESHGKTVSEDVISLSWQGGSLPDDWYDEFVFRSKIAANAEGTLWLTVKQICANGEVSWDEIPAEGQDPHSLKRPALGLQIIPADHHQH